MANSKRKTNRVKSSPQQKLANLSPKKQVYVARRLKGDSKRRAALTAKFSVAMANKASTKIETPDVRDAIKSLMERVAPLKKLAKRIGEGVDAEKTEFAKFKGRIKDSRNTVDFEQRRKYSELALRLHGVMITDEDGNRGQAPITVVIDC